MTSASSHSSSTSSPLGSGQTTTMALTSSYQQLNHALPVKLDRTNYVLWKSQIDNIVFANGFEDFIDGTSVCPEKELSAGSAWNALEKTFSSSSRARIMQLRLELQSVKKGSLSMIDYIIKVKRAVDSLAAIGEPVFEQDQVMNLLGGLGSDYNAPIMPLPLITEVVEGDTMAVEDTTTQASLQMPAITTTEAVVSKQHPAMVASSNNLADDNWYLDSRASHHLTQNAGNLINFTPYTRTDKVIVGNGKHLSISNINSHRLVSNSRSFQLRKDLHMKKILAQGRLENGLYKFPALSNKKMAYIGIKDFSVFHSLISRTIHNEMDIWHHRLGHAATDVVVQTLQSCNVSYEKNKATDYSTICSSCQLAKSHRLRTHLSSSCVSKPLELIHMDI
ncbi:hypothetical protein POTOM_040425 [Populus tomentosa]|uniref:GAG-pre-integrase domain-containing protein n=1 Tax=Populus tomentosa TaxID=118781 RepID=A0A8X7YKQ5_POPTO|nr:hypothetical protein POTOM_040425 [Populus tomentosa]